MCFFYFSTFFLRCHRVTDCLRRLRGHFVDFSLVQRDEGMSSKGWVCFTTCLNQRLCILDVNMVALVWWYCRTSWGCPWFAFASAFATRLWCLFPASWPSSGAFHKNTKIFLDSYFTLFGLNIMHLENIEVNIVFHHHNLSLSSHICV